MSCTSHTPSRGTSHGETIEVVTSSDHDVDTCSCATAAAAAAPATTTSTSTWTRSSLGEIMSKAFGNDWWYGERFQNATPLALFLHIADPDGTLNSGITKVVLPVVAKTMKDLLKDGFYIMMDHDVVELKIDLPGIFGPPTLVFEQFLGMKEIEVDFAFPEFCQREITLAGEVKNIMYISWSIKGCIPTMLMRSHIRFNRPTPCAHGVGEVDYEVLKGYIHRTVGITSGVRRSDPTYQYQIIGSKDNKLVECTIADNTVSMKMLEGEVPRKAPVAASSAAAAATVYTTFEPFRCTKCGNTALYNGMVCDNDCTTVFCSKCRADHYYTEDGMLIGDHDPMCGHGM